MTQGAQKIMKLSLELGGNAPFIVFNDADLEAAVKGALESKFRNNGQTCMCANRIYVQSGIHDAFVERLSKPVSEMKVGNGMDLDTVPGPLINSQAMAKFNAHILDAVGKGARGVAEEGRHTPWAAHSSSPP